jgi:hypothetical protein
MVISRRCVLTGSAAVGLAFSMRVGFGGAGTNPLTIFENAPQNGSGVNLVGVSDPTGYTSAPTALTSGETTLIQLIIGDSKGSNSGQSAYTSTHTKSEMLNIYSGLNYQYKDPYLGPSTGPGSYPGTTADQLITAGKFSRVISIGAAMGGCTSHDYSKSGAFNHRARVALLYARALGWPVATGAADTWRMAVIYALGTNDNALGLSASYSANAQSCFDSLRDYGFGGKIFVAKSSMLTNAVNSTIQAAQAALVNNPAGIYVGADEDSLTGATNRVADGTHLTSTGEVNLASLWANIFVAQY